MHNNAINPTLLAVRWFSLYAKSTYRQKRELLLSLSRDEIIREQVIYLYHLVNNKYQ